MDADAWYDNEVTPEQSASNESFSFDGRSFKDPRQYCTALYRKDMSQCSQLDAEEQIALAHIVRKGLLCLCGIVKEDRGKLKRKRRHIATADPEEREKLEEELKKQEEELDKLEKKLVRRANTVFHLLDPTDEEKLWVNGLGRDKKNRFVVEGNAAQNKMAESNLPLVMSIAKSEYNQMEFLDKVQAGNLGLIKAIQYFNPYKGNRFSTYAKKLILHEIRDQANKLRIQKAGPKKWENFTPKATDIDRVIERMGGVYWMNQITSDTEQSGDRIKRQIAALLEQKVMMESVANDAISGFPVGYDEVLESVEEDFQETTQSEALIGGSAGSGNSNDYDSHYSGKRPRFDIITGDRKPPKDIQELSFEDYVREFFGLVMNVKAIPCDLLGAFPHENRNDIKAKFTHMTDFLKEPEKESKNVPQKGPWGYTEELAIYDLSSLIASGSIWPEQLMIERAKSWGWLGLSGYETEFPDLSYFIDRDHPTESMALILLSKYTCLRQAHILASMRLTMEYFGWLCLILQLVGAERLNKRDDAILNDLADGKRYVDITDKHHVSSTTVSKAKDKVGLIVYDQIVESSNVENGSALMKCLIYRYQNRTIKKWNYEIISRMVRNHYVEKERFALRSRGEADGPRPFMEIFTKFAGKTKQVTEAVAESFTQGVFRGFEGSGEFLARVVPTVKIPGDFMNKYVTPVQKSMKRMNKITSLLQESFDSMRKYFISDEFQKRIRELSELQDDSDLDDFTGMEEYFTEEELAIIKKDLGLTDVDAADTSDALTTEDTSEATTSEDCVPNGNDSDNENTSHTE